MMTRISVFLQGILAAVLLCSMPVPAESSDHADPIDLFDRVELEGGITDLFVFPDRNFTQLVVILCVRRALPGSENLDLNLEPYTYEVYMDLHSRIDFSDEQSRYRYGGRVANPRGIFEDVTLSFRLDNQAAIVGTPKIRGLGNVRERIQVWSGPVDDAKPRGEESWAGGPLPSRINIWSGVADDPFIFPAFFGTNVVAIVTTLPMELFEGQQDWIVWGSSFRDGERVDHVGRPLRTQNPRFELLNKLHPRDHAAAIREEHEHPSLMRDLLLRLGFSTLFAYRTWDHVPDVMIYTRRPLVFVEGGRPSDGTARFPNGRRLQDDVAEELARYGDTLLKEASYITGGWPRATQNDQPFQSTFPYLAKPSKQSPAAASTSLATASKIKLAAIAVIVLALWVATAFALASGIRYVSRRRPVPASRRADDRSVLASGADRANTAPPPGFHGATVDPVNVLRYE